MDTIIETWKELYSSLNRTEINNRICEIKNSQDVHQKVYQLRALEILMLNNKN
jgi:hypothetical protein